MTAHWGWPQWVMAAWFAFFIVLGAAQRRDPGDRARFVTVNAIEAFIFWWGGFWS